MTEAQGVGTSYSRWYFFIFINCNFNSYISSVIVGNFINSSRDGKAVSVYNINGVWRELLVWRSGRVDRDNLEIVEFE